jgi:hypothetical protein
VSRNLRPPWRPLVLAALALAARPLAAQTTPEVFYACYAPANETVYRIKQPGLPQACTAPHVEFSWTEGAAAADDESPDPTAALLLSVASLNAQVRELERANAALQDATAGLWNELSRLRAQFERLDGERR